jgi:hypothetical protein
VSETKRKRSVYTLLDLNLPILIVASMPDFTPTPKTIVQRFFSWPWKPWQKFDLTSTRMVALSSNGELLVGRGTAEKMYSLLLDHPKGNA